MQTLSAGRIQPGRQTAEAIETRNVLLTVNVLVAEFMRRAVASWRDDGIDGGALQPYCETADWRIRILGQDADVLETISQLTQAIDENMGCHGLEALGMRLAIRPNYLKAELGGQVGGFFVLIHMQGTLTASAA